MNFFIFKYIFILLLLFISFYLKRFFFLSRKEKNHRNIIQNADKIYKKLNSFSGDNKYPQIINYLKKINPYSFEELVLTALEKQGYKITRSKSYSGDGGCDGICYKNDKKYLLQMKRYSNHVSSAHLHDFHNLIVKSSAAGGMFIHSGKTAAIQLSNFKETNLKVISGNRLVDLIVSIHKFD